MEKCRELLALASVVGREFHTDVLAAVSGVEPVFVVDHLDEAVAIGMLMTVPNPPGRYRFAHEIVREVLYDDLPATRAMTLHRAVAEAFEAIYAAELDLHAAELAHHFAMAAPAGTAARRSDMPRGQPNVRVTSSRMRSQCVFSRRLWAPTKCKRTGTREPGASCCWPGGMRRRRLATELRRRTAS